MPVYEYQCKGCDHEFEREQRISDKPVKKCPSCGAMKVKRLISQTSFVLKGGGWYGDLYSSAKPDGKSDDKSESASDGAKSESSEKKKDKGGKKGKKSSGKSGGAKGEKAA
ncbi:MAG: zinc ribbon domain-containing protein [Myxococcota bacterium]|nr:zinc ribbon domain-containing protein [Myxococcota bacterium]